MSSNNKKILLTGANGYIGKRLLPNLIARGFDVVCGVRDPNRFAIPETYKSRTQVIQLDLSKSNSLANIPTDIVGAYYLVHSMSSNQNYYDLEEKCALNFIKAVAKTTIQHVIYLSGIVNETKLSQHLSSRNNVEQILKTGNFHLTSFRAGIIVGSGSASFEIIRDLVEKLPIMVTPKWLNTLTQPISVHDVLTYLTKGMLRHEIYDKNYDIGGPDILTYKSMLLQFAEIRKLKRHIITIPIMTPKLSSYWLYFVTSTSFKLAKALVESMKIEVICRPSNINQLLNVDPIRYKTAIERAFQKIETNQITSSWKDSFISSETAINTLETSSVPTYGCFKDIREAPVLDFNNSIDKIWKLGGNNGWYYASWIWKVRGLIDKLIGGVGLRRGRTNLNAIKVGDALDFWRVLIADKQNGHLLLYAEMKLPGEAWLEFKLTDKKLTQTATFRPLGVAGRLYWYLVTPFHFFIFKGMAKRIAS